MKKLFSIFALMMLAVLFGRAATVTFTMTNSVGNPDTNSILIQPIASSINADGSVQTAGLPFRIYPNTGGIVSTNLQGGNYLATNAFICSQYVGPGNFGTSQGIIFAVPNSSGTYPFGQLAISGYNVFNYNGASFVVTASNIFAAIGYTPLTPQQVTNLFLLCNTNIYQASTNIVFVLSNGITLVTAPPQGFLTNGLVDRTITNGLATTNYASMTASNIAAIYTTTNQFTWGTNWVYTNWIAQLNLFGSSSTNFTVGASNSLAANGLAQLQATNTSLTAAIIASNAAQASALQAATNSLWANKQQSNGVLTSLAGGLAWTNLNFGLLPGTNFSFATNLSTGQVTLAVPTQWWLTNLLSTMAYTPTNWYLPTNALPALTNGFITSSALTPYLLSATAALTYYPLSNPSNFVGNSVTNGLATTNYVLGVIVASNANFVTFAQVQSSNTLAILTAATLGTNFGYQIGTGATNYANGVGTAVTNDVMAASNNVLTTATAQLNGTNANTLNVATNLVAALQARAVTNTQASVSFSAIGPVTGSLAVTIGGGSISGAFGTLNAGGLTTGGGTLGALGYLGLGWITNATYAVLASNLVNAGALAYSNTVTSNNVAGKINVGQVFGAATTNGFLPVTNAFAQNQFGFGARANFLVTTNIIGILGGGSSTEGTYLGINLNMTWTNYFNPAFTILASGGNYFLMSNSVTLYSSPDLVNWSIVSGVTPVPTGFFGTKWHMTGTLMDGWMIPTNIYQSFAGVVTGNITNLQFSAAGLGTIEGLPFSGLVGGTMTNTFFTSAGSNYIASIVLLLAENPTNGATVSTVSNIVANYGATLFLNTNSGWNTNGNYAVAGSVLGTLNSTPLQAVVDGTNVAQWSMPLLNDVIINQGFGNVIVPDSGSTSNRNSAILSGINNYIGGAALNDPNDGRGNIIVGGDSNTNNSLGFGIILGGWHNMLSSYPFEFIGIGSSNFVQSINYGMILNGSNNRLLQHDSIISGLGFGANSIFSGYNNTVAGSAYSWIGGGTSNQINNFNITGAATGSQLYDVILTGTNNNIRGGASYSIILNGWNNLIENSGGVGGRFNQMAGNTILGGTNNIVDQGTNVIIGGCNIDVTNVNVLVFSDGSSPISVTTPNTAVVQYINGIEFLNTPVDSTVGFTVNGLPVSSTPQTGLYISQLNGIGTNATLFLTNVISGTYFLQSSANAPKLPNLIVSGAAGTNAFLNGVYQSATNDNSYFTNVAGNNFIIATPTTAGSATTTGFYLITNFTLFNNVTWKNTINSQQIPKWANNSLVGIYNGATANGGATLGNVQVAFGQFTPTSTSVAVNTNNAGTNTLYVFGPETVNGDLTATNFVGNGSSLTNLNAAQLTGTIPPSANQATITNQTQNIYNDTNALWFANTAGMTDQTARNNLVLGVQALKQAGVWTHIVSAGILDPLDNPGKHIDLLGNPFSVVNESYTQSGGYGAAGLSDGGTNYVLIPLPRIITNYTLVFWFWNSPSNADRLIGFNSGIPSAQAHLYNTNDFSGVVMEQPNAFRNARIWSSTSGTNWNIPGNANHEAYTTNAAAYMQNGQYDGRTPVGLMYVSAYSGGTNGIVCHFSNSKPSCFTTGGMNTNDLFLSTNSPYNMLEIGGAATNWGMVYANNTNCIATIGGWILFDSRSDGDWRYQVAGYKFATDVSRYTAVKEFGGSSIVNDSASGGIVFNGGVVCETNTMPTIYQQLNPSTLVLCDAAPGSSMANYATMQGKGTNYFSPYDVLNLDTNRFIPFLMEVDTDGPRNDGLAGTSLPIIYGFFTNWSCYFSAGIPFFLIDDHWDYSTSIAGNLNWRSTIAMVVSNLPISGVIVESTHIGSNFLSHASADNPPVHNTALNWQAYQQAYGFAVLCAHQPWPYPWLDVTWNCISQGSPLMDAGITNMNQMYFPVLDAQGNQRVTQDGSGLTNFGGAYLIKTNGTQLAVTNLLGKPGVFFVSLAFDDVTGGNPSCHIWETNSVFTNDFGIISPNLSGLTLVGTVSITNAYTFVSQTNSTLTIVDTSSGGAAVRKVIGQTWNQP